MRTATALLLLTTLVLPASARADPSPRPTTDVTRMVTDDCARARKAGKTCVIEVQAEDIAGTTPSAGGLAVQVISFGPARSLIRLRHDFIPEIVKAADDL